MNDLPSSMIYTQEEIPLHEYGTNRKSKIDLTIHRSSIKRRLMYIDFIASDCFTGTYYRLKMDDNVYINLEEDKESSIYTLVDFYKMIIKYLKQTRIDEARLINNGQCVQLKLFDSSPLINLERLEGKDMILMIEELIKNEDKITNEMRSIRAETRARWCNLTTKIIRNQLTPTRIHNNRKSKMNYLNAVRQEICAVKEESISMRR